MKSKATPPAHLQCSQTKWDELRAKAADENFHYVPIGDYFLSLGFVSSVKRNLLDPLQYDPSIGVQSVVEEAFWQSLDDELRDLVGPTIAFILENEEWIEAEQREIASLVKALARGGHD